MDVIGELLTVAAANSPERLAVRLRGGRSVTYADLDARSNRLATALLGLGLPRQARLATWLEDSVEYVEVYMAAAKAGHVVVPINSRFKVDEAKYQVDKSGATALFFSKGVAERAMSLLEQTPLQLAVSTDPRPIEKALNFEDVIERGSDRMPPTPHEDDPYLIGFTSGTTGFPKGTILTHRSVKNTVRTQAAALRLSLGSVSAHLASMSFPATVTSLMLTHLYVGGTTILMGHWELDELLATIRAERVNFFYLPTPAISAFIDEVRRDVSILDTVTSVLHAGSRADPDVLRKLSDVIGHRYIEGWGMTELSGALATVTSLRDTILPESTGDYFMSVGRPVPDCLVKVVDADRNPVAHDGATIGELAVRSSSTMRGYWEDEAATDHALVDGWYYSGDMGSIDSAGYVYVSDRRSDLIVSGGMNIYPAELEHTIERLEGVLECAVVGVAHPRWGQSPVAVVRLNPESHLSESDIVSFCRRHLANYKRPQRVIFVESLPRNSSNKIQRHLVKALIEPLSASSGPSEADR